MIKILGKKKVARRIFWVLAIIIIPSFVFWGIDAGQRSARHNLVARVNGSDITRREFYERLNNMIEQRRQFFGEEIEMETPEMEEIRRQALETLIREEIIRQEARRRRLRVPDYEIEAQFRRNPAFLDEEGRFDRERFRYIVEYMPEEQLREIEEQIRRSLTTQLLQHEITRAGGVEITDEYVEEYKERFDLGEHMDDETIREYAEMFEKNRIFDEWYESAREKARIEIFLEENS